MRKKLLFSLLLSNLLNGNASTIILNGNVEVVSIVGFDKTEVENSDYETNTNTFKGTVINSNLVPGQRFTVSKNIYIKSNTSSSLEMHIEANTPFGMMMSDLGGIFMQYSINETTLQAKPGNTKWITIPSTAHEITTLDSGKGFIASSTNTIQAEQAAGIYSVTLAVTIRAKVN